jgi:uncharacterized membrane protein YhaH (DUF805 family)
MSTTATADIYDAPQSDLGLEVPKEQSGLFGFKGRLSVLGYMARSALLLLAMAAIGVAFYFSLGGMSGLLSVENSQMGTLPLVMSVVFALSFIPFMWIGMALLAKRLHDINRSGWWMLLTLVPIVGMIYALYISLKPGNPEDNHFGVVNPAEGWEKPLGILGIVLTVALVGGSLIVDGMALLGFSY